MASFCLVYSYVSKPIADLRTVSEIAAPISANVSISSVAEMYASVKAFEFVNARGIWLAVKMGSTRRA